VDSICVGRLDQPPPQAAQIAATPDAAGGHVPCSCRILSLAAGGFVDMTSYSTPFPMQHERTPKSDQWIPNYGHCSASTRWECMRMSELEVTSLDLQRAPYGREACCRVVQGIMTTINSISVGRFDQNLGVQRISPSQQPNWMCMPIQHHIAIWRPTSTKGAIVLHVHPPPIDHTRCVKGSSVYANHTATAVKSAIASSLYVATECTGVMSGPCVQTKVPSLGITSAAV
jgi:hypothetical protein